MTSASTTLPRRTLRFNRPVLVSNLVSGGLWLLVPVVLGSWPLGVIGAVYVVVASLFLAATYARPTLTARQEAMAWGVPWVAAVLLWVLIIAAIDFQSTPLHYTLSVLVGLLIGTGCYLVWQVLALAIRQVLVWRSPRSPLT